MVRNICRNCRGNGSTQIYSSLSEAKIAAKLAKSNGSWVHLSFKCPKCGKWYLSHSRPCAYCTDRRKEPKDLYHSIGAALHMAKLRSKPGARLNVYECPYEHGYHLTGRTVGGC